MTHKADISEALTRHQAIKVAWNAYVGASMDPANTNLEAMSAAIDAYDALSTEGSARALRDIDYLIDDVVADAASRGAEGRNTDSMQSTKTLHDAIAALARSVGLG